MLYLGLYILLGIPIAAILFFIISLWCYCYAKMKNKKFPGSFSAEKMKIRKILLIVSSMIAGVLAMVVITFVGLLFTAVAFM